MRKGIVRGLVCAVALVALSAPALALDPPLEKCGTWSPPDSTITSIYRCQNAKITVSWGWTTEANNATFPKTLEEAIFGYINPANTYPPNFQCPLDKNTNGGIGMIGICYATGYEVIAQWGELDSINKLMRHYATVRFYYWSSI